MTFKLDTSGRIAGHCAGLAVWYEFGDLDAFTQGYIEAILNDAIQRIQNKQIAPLSDVRRWPGFSDLAPDTLARIMEDCAAHERAYPMLAHDPRRNNRGKNFWRNRQGTMWVSSNWPPLTVALSDDGKVVFQ